MFARLPGILVFMLAIGWTICPAAAASAQQAGPAVPPAAVRTAKSGVSLNHVSAEASDKSAAPRRDSNWAPFDVDENVLPVDPNSVCDLDRLLLKAGVNIQEFVRNVERFTATESLDHESVNKSGAVFLKARRNYNYMASIAEIRPNIFSVEEFLNTPSSLPDTPGGLATKGLPALALIFHPFYSQNFAMKCEGLATWNGQKAWRVYFRQREDQPNRMRSYKIGLNGPAYAVPLKGRAWFVPDTFQIVGLETDLIHSLPEVQLVVDHTLIEYGPVFFPSRGADFWLPQNAEVYSDFRGKRVHERTTFTNYLLFAVDDRQYISVPKADP